MPGKTVLRIVFPMIFALVAVSAIRPQTALKESSFVRDANRPFVYLKFERIGTGVRRNEAEPSLRAWFRFVNNSSAPIRLRTYGEPKGSSADEVGVMDDVVADQPIFTITASSAVPEVEHQPTSDMEKSTAKATVERQRERKMPFGYSSEVSSATTVASGESVLFSVSVDHLGSPGSDWHMEIPFWFAVPKGRGPRDPVVGGEPVMSLHYHFYDLPDEAQARLRGESHD
jgi:hypothetical protein